MKVVISLGGILFVDAAHIKAVAAVLEELANSHTIYVVTGGGQPAREYIAIARE